MENGLQTLNGQQKLAEWATRIAECRNSGQSVLSWCKENGVCTQTYRINRRPSQIKTPDSYPGINWDKDIEHRKSSVRSKVEHVFLIVKRDFGYRKVVYRGLAKNLNRFYFLFASANLVMYLRDGHKKPISLAG